MATGKNTPFRNIRISRTGGQHGPDALYAVPAMAEVAGDAMGFVLEADGTPAVYVVGDTI